MSGESLPPRHESLTISKACIFGARGLLGTALTASLLRDGVSVTSYSRSRSHDRPGMAHWDPKRGEIDVERLAGADAVVNLAGEDLGQGRWSEARKRSIRSSRVESTALLARTLAELPEGRRPGVLVNASAVGFYGDRGDEAVNEQSPAGEGFLAELCQAWEAAAAPAVDVGMRVVLLRFGVVLTTAGGALPKLMGPIKLGLGGPLGGGQQRMPWISMFDAVGVIRFAIGHDELAGPVNAVAPESISNAQLTEALGERLHRRTFLPVPRLALRLALGEMADALLLEGANVRPRKLEVAGYRFEYPRLEDALDALLSPNVTTAA